MIGEIVKNYLIKYPQSTTRSLATLVYNENREKFKDFEHARTTIRRYRGEMGETKRRELTDRRFLNPPKQNKYNIPSADQRDYTPYILPKSASNILVLNDIHIPYHDPEAIELALDWGVEHGINTILLNGDVLDFYQLSRFTKDPTSRSIKGEIEKLKEFLEGIRTFIPQVKVYYKMGNHEERFENYMKVKAPELFDMTQFRLSEILQLGSLGVEYIGDKRIVMAGKLPILHGHEFNGVSSSVNAARGLYLKTKQSAMIGHLHTSSEHNEPNLEGELFTTWSVACMCYLHPEYAPINKWNNGFAHIKIAPNGDFRVFNARMYNGQIL